MEKYSKAEKIGEGSFGVAFLARVKGSNKQVVLKEINLKKMTKKESDEAKKEVAVLAQLKHCNVVSYLESFELNGNLYIVMDFCDGGDLFGRINAQHGMLFSEEQTLDWFVQMCFAVKHIHDRKILHRDIKSQNIFLTKSGIVKLGDFGIAKVLDSTVELARTCIGTPYYLSPEICEAKPYNNKSDIWSLGCVLYELMTLKHAFEAPSMRALVLNIVRGLYTPPSSKYSPELRSLIAVMFKKNPRDRPSVTTILKKPLLQATIQGLLSKLEIAEEFNRTAIAGAKAQQAIQAVQARPLPPRPASAASKQPMSPYAQRYNPAAVYGPSIACRKSRENLCKDSRKSAEAKKPVTPDRPNNRRPSSSGNSRPPSAGPVVQDPAKRRQEFNEKENERRKEILRKQDFEIQRQHKLLIERQKLSRMNRNREDGWKNVLNSSNSEEKEPAAGVVGNVREIGNYEHHLAQLRKLEERSHEPDPGQQLSYQKPGENPSEKVNQPLQNGGVIVGDRVQIYQEFIQRKEAAALNRARAHGGMPLPLNALSPVKPVWPVAQLPNPVNAPVKYSWAVVPSPSPIPSPVRPSWALVPPATPIVPPAKQIVPATPPSGIAVPCSGDHVSKVLDEGHKKEEVSPIVKLAFESPNPHEVSSDARPSSARVWEDEKKRQDEEYEAKLRQIRLQNFNERYLREIKAAQNRGFSNVFGNKNERLKELELIRDQAAARAKRCREELEKRRQELEERKLQENRVQNPEFVVRPVGALPIRVIQNKLPAPSVGMTSAMVAIGAAKQEVNVVESERAQAKKSILKRVNMSFSESEDEPARGKWAKAGVTRVLGQMELEDQGQWKNSGITNVLSKMDLEEHKPPVKEDVDSDNSPSGRIPNANVEEESIPTDVQPRRRWPSQRGTVVSILSNATICEATGGISIPSSEQTPNESEQQETETETSAAPIGAVSKETESTEHLVDISQATQLLEVHEDNRQEDENETASDDLKGACLSSGESQKATEDDHQLGMGEFEEAILRADTEEKLFLPGKGFSLMESLATGKFDAPDVKMLRTCSEPDLHKLLLSENLTTNGEIKLPAKSSGDIKIEELVTSENAANNEMMNPVAAEVQDDSAYNDSVTDLYPNDLDHSVVFDEDYEDVEGKLFENTLEAEDCDIDETGFESEDSDLRTLRESMANILANNVEVSDEEQAVSLVTKTKKKMKKGKSSKKGKKRKPKESPNEESSSTGKVWGESSFDDFQIMKETMRSLLQPTKPSSNAVQEKSNQLSGIGESSQSLPSDVVESIDTEEAGGTDTLLMLNNVNESIDSDVDRLDDEYFEDEGIFARLEGMRASLEDQLGCETFLKAYMTVQAFQEEDEDMEEGIKMVTRILGPDNIYLYPSILQLVMADASFSENG